MEPSCPYLGAEARLTRSPNYTPDANATRRGFRLKEMAFEMITMNEIVIEACTPQHHRGGLSGWNITRLQITPTLNPRPEKDCPQPPSTVVRPVKNNITCDPYICTCTCVSQCVLVAELSPTIWKVAVLIRVNATRRNKHPTWAVGRRVRRPHAHQLRSQAAPGFGRPSSELH